jgi:hypothetical protein
MTINIPGKAQTAFQGNMQTSAAVELPFPAPAFYIVNGDAKLAALKNVQYFGGWACNVEKLREAADHYSNVPYPIPGFHELNMVADDGKTYDVLTSRSLVVATVGMRQFSTIKDASGNKKRVAPFTKGARPGIQVLCILAYRNEQKQIVPWAPVMLTANGYQVNHIQKAIQTWRKTIKPYVGKLVPGADDSILNLFYMHIGTFGAERKAEPAGEKSITPVSAFIPDEMDEKKIENLYVGEPMAEFMADISEKSQEWLKVFSNMQQAQPSRNQPEEMIEESPLPPEDDIPF